jgi:Aspartyl protease
MVTATHVVGDDCPDDMCMYAYDTTQEQADPRPHLMAPVTVKRPPYPDGRELDHPHQGPFGDTTPLPNPAILAGYRKNDNPGSALPRAPAVGPARNEEEAMEQHLVTTGTSVAKRALHRTVPLTIAELYELAGDPFRKELQHEFNTLHTRVSRQEPRAQLAAAPMHAMQPRRILEAARAPTSQARARPEPLLTFPAYINGRACTVTFDTGAQFNMITVSAVNMLGLNCDKQAKVGFRGVDGLPQQSLGVVSCNVRLGPCLKESVVTHQEFLAIDDGDPTHYTILGGLPLMKSLGMTIDLQRGAITIRKDNTSYYTIPLASPVDESQDAYAVCAMVRDGMQVENGRGKHNGRRRWTDIQRQRFRSPLLRLPNPETDTNRQRLPPNRHWR